MGRAAWEFLMGLEGLTPLHGGIESATTFYTTVNSNPATSVTTSAASIAEYVQMVSVRSTSASRSASVPPDQGKSDAIDLTGDGGTSTTGQIAAGREHGMASFVGVRRFCCLQRVAYSSLHTPCAV